MTILRRPILILLSSCLQVAALHAESAADNTVTIIDIACTAKVDNQCMVDSYDADGNKAEMIAVPPIVTSAGMQATRHGKSLVAITAKGRTAYLSRGDVTIKKSLAAANPGAAPCVARTGTMGSSCPGGW